jgi:hypothetical protein
MCKAILLIGSDELLVSKICAFLRECYPTFSIFNTLSLPDMSSKSIGMPLTNVLFDNGFGPLSKLIFLPTDTVVIYLNNQSSVKFDDFEDYIRTIVSIGLNNDSDMYDYYIQSVKGLAGSYYNDSTSQYQQTLAARKEILKEKFIVKYSALNIGELKIDFKSHFDEWEMYCSKKGFNFVYFDSLEPIMKNISLSKNIMFIDLIKCISYYLKTNKIRRRKTEFNSWKDVDFKRNTPKFQSVKVELKSSICMAYSAMGFGDHIQRLERLYSVCSYYTSSNFMQPVYVNPHVKKLDFDSLIDVKMPYFPENADGIGYIFEFEEFFFLLNLHCLVDDPEVTHHIYLHKATVKLDYIFAYLPICTDFYNNTSYKFALDNNESGNIFSVVYHMRRHDTAISLIEGFVEGPILKRLGVKRRLLNFDDFDAIVSNYFSKRHIYPDKVNITLVSDGFLDLKARYSAVAGRLGISERPSTLKKFDDLEFELLQEESNLDNSKVVNRIIGRDVDCTIDSTKAIANADLVVTSSGFAIVIAKVGGVDFINGLTGM